MSLPRLGSALHSSIGPGANGIWGGLQASEEEEVRWSGTPQRNFSEDPKVDIFGSQDVDLCGEVSRE